jgi:hypothetical protein
MKHHVGALLGLLFAAAISTASCTTSTADLFVVNHSTVSADLEVIGKDSVPQWYMLTPNETGVIRDLPLANVTYTVLLAGPQCRIDDRTWPPVGATGSVDIEITADRKLDLTTVSHQGAVVLVASSPPSGCK